MSRFQWIPDAIAVFATIVCLGFLISIVAPPSADDDADAGIDVECTVEPCEPEAPRGMYPAEVTPGELG